MLVTMTDTGASPEQTRKLVLSAVRAIVCSSDQ
jgi:hypothetical protein